MLFRLDLLRSTDEEAWNLIRRISVEAYSVRLWLTSFLFVPDSKGRAAIPGCHSVAHAFAKTFGYRAVDGEHCYQNSVRVLRDGVSMRVSSTTLLHSWVECETSRGKRFILDIFPDNGSSIFPVLYEAPHPAYWIPVDEARVRNLKNLHRRVTFQRDVALLAKNMRRMAQKNKLPTR